MYWLLDAYHTPKTVWSICHYCSVVLIFSLGAYIQCNKSRSVCMHAQWDLSNQTPGHFVMSQSILYSTNSPLEWGHPINLETWSYSMCWPGIILLDVYLPSRVYCFRIGYWDPKLCLFILCACANHNHTAKENIKAFRVVPQYLTYFALNLTFDWLASGIKYAPIYFTGLIQWIGLFCCCQYHNIILNNSLLTTNYPRHLQG